MPAPPFAQQALRAASSAVSTATASSSAVATTAAVAAAAGFASTKYIRRHRRGTVQSGQSTRSASTVASSSSSSVAPSSSSSSTCSFSPSPSEYGFLPSISQASTHLSPTSASVLGFKDSLVTPPSFSASLVSNSTSFVKSPQQQQAPRSRLPQVFFSRALPKYPFPAIPRPRRNFLYYNPVSTLKRGLSTLGRVRPSKSLSLRGIRFQFPARLRRYAGRREYSTAPSQQQQEGGAPGQGSKKARAKRVLWSIWALPAITTVILWSVLRQKKPEQGEQSSPEHAGKPAQPWKVAAYSTLPLKSISRLWGRFNDIDLPLWMREPGYKLYSYLFGVNLDEVAEADLKTYPNLGEFFYRELKPGARPIDAAAPLVSPADGKVLHLGVITDGQVEQVKGITYSLDALLGSGGHANHAAPSRTITDFEEHKRFSPEEIMERHEEFARLNGISYTVDDLLGKDEHASSSSSVKDDGDATAAGGLKDTDGKTASDDDAAVKVAQSLYAPPYSLPSENELFFAVIYLAPGDYHRFHSPTNWVTELRRHFVGELYSVAPYFQSRLSNLFVLNERVALLGKWKYGFFSMTPVGATNVGSIKLHFDKKLATNTVYESPDAAPSDDESVASGKTRVKKATCYEATYAKASPLLGGYPLLKGQQMGGFNLGSTVVLVFEAPKNFEFDIKRGEKVRVGQPLGHFEG